MENGSASSLTVAGPRVRRSTTDLLVGSDNAENVVLSGSTTIWLCIARRKSSGFNEARDQLSEQVRPQRISHNGDRRRFGGKRTDECRHLSEAVQYHESNQPSITLSHHLTLSAGVVSVATLCRSRR